MICLQRTQRISVKVINNTRDFFLWLVEGSWIWWKIHQVQWRGCWTCSRNNVACSLWWIGSCKGWYTSHICMQLKVASGICNYGLGLSPSLLFGHSCWAPNADVVDHDDYALTQQNYMLFNKVNMVAIYFIFILFFNLLLLYLKCQSI